MIPASPTRCRRCPTEVAYLNGEIVRLGRAHAIQTPVNEKLLNLVQEVEEQRLGRSRKVMTASELLVAVGMSG